VEALKAARRVAKMTALKTRQLALRMNIATSRRLGVETRLVI
jgi:hypothetical protein